MNSYLFCVQPNSQGMSNGKKKFFDAASNETSFSMVPTESQIVPKPPPKKTYTLQQIFKASSFMIPKLKKKVNILQLKYFSFSFFLLLQQTDETTNNA